MNLPANNLLKPAGAFTAARIAACLGTSPQAVRNRLLDTPATGVRIVGGIEAAAWSVHQLPESLRKRLDEEAAGGSYRDAAALLAEPPKQWQAPLPLDKIADAHIEGARKLREALRPWLAQQDDTTLAGKALETKGLADYCRVFGRWVEGR